MNRCLAQRTVFQHFTAAIALACGVGLAQGQALVRQLPEKALIGTLQVIHPPEVLLNGQAARLSPGARIRSESNTLVLSASLAGQVLPVAYVLEPLGLVHEVWILNAAEHAAIAARAGAQQ
ncbi:MAG: hypothetical protein ACT4NV_19775 [Rhodoferax sp.]